MRKNRQFTLVCNQASVVPATVCAGLQNSAHAYCSDHIAKIRLSLTAQLARVRTNRKMACLRRESPQRDGFAVVEAVLAEHSAVLQRQSLDLSCLGRCLGRYNYACRRWCEVVWRRMDSSPGRGRRWYAVEQEILLLRAMQLGERLPVRHVVATRSEWIVSRAP